MEQTLTMDKKLQSRPPPLQSKNQDTSKSGYDNLAKRNGNQYPRKRENEKPDNHKKSPANRGGRAGQRYVRPREKVDCQVEQNHPQSELGSLQRSGGRKQNITHLLNWWGPGPDRLSNRGWASDHGSGRGYRSRKYSNYYPKYNKENYLQANCQFVVTAGHDYSAYEADPDQLVGWEFVEEVRLHSSESPSCPICLHPPVAAQITHCGHIFCFPCILHYLALTDEQWRKCPICFDPVSKTDLKSVVVILHKDYTSNQEIVLMLMRRDRDSLIPVPLNAFDPSLAKKKTTTISSPDAALPYSKLIVASKSEVSKVIVARELEELACQLALEADQPEACFIQEALSFVAQRNLQLDSENLCDKTSLGAAQKPPNPPLLTQAAAGIENLRLSEDQREAASEDRSPPSSPQTEVSLTERSLATTQPNAGTQVLDNRPQPTPSDGRGGPRAVHYFYQESSGAHIYLHAINLHMLAREYGALENSPLVIKAKVLEKESESMTEAHRQRLRYLRHLPITCPFEVVEVELKPPLVSRLTVAEFEGQLGRRERERRRRAKAEDRIERRARAEADRLMGRGVGVRVNTASWEHFPSFAPEDLSPPQFCLVEESVASSPSLTDEPVEAGGAPSFAQMIRCGPKKPAAVGSPQEAFPSLATSSSDRRPSHRVQVKGAPRWSVPASDDDDDGDEEAERVPDFSTAFSDAFAKALDRAAHRSSESWRSAPEPSDNASIQRGKKGKRKKGIVLLSSGGR